MLINSLGKKLICALSGMVAKLACVCACACVGVAVFLRVSECLPYHHSAETKACRDVEVNLRRVCRFQGYPSLT